MEKHLIAVNWNLFFIFTGIGLSPFSFNKRHGHIRESIWKNLWSALVLSVVLFNYCCQNSLNSIHPKRHGLVITFSEWTMTVMSMIFLACSVIQAVIKRKIQIECIESINEIDFIMQNRFACPIAENLVNKSTMKRFIWLIAIWLSKHILGLICSNKKMLRLYMLFYLAPIVFLSIARLLMQTFFIDSICFRLKVINAELSLYNDENISGTSKRNFQETVIHVQAIYAKIWKAFCKVNLMFGWSSITLVLKLFVYLIVISFWCITGPKKIELTVWEQIESGLEILFNISTKSFLCHSASTCRMEANKTSEILLKPLECGLNDENVRDFVAQMNHQPFITSANGFFDIDYSLLGSVLAATATYIVIMLQLEQS
ncbi:gustatory receptor 68a-like [Uranotaenia lowii]|uniref:gustatory receptor 68a-like n=1 Tax=Uranotaenia lowii TaxID=190385 RepID=UPI00247AF5E9|nr:gustatory receptor 68a-like [Uranotaenia lowii]